MAKTKSSRIALHEALSAFAADNGFEGVYFQPPNDLHKNYPCICYKLRNIDKVSADNINYILHDRYEVTFLMDDPDDGIESAHAFLNKFVTSKFVNDFVSAGLYHFIFDLYF